MKKPRYRYPCYRCGGNAGMHYYSFMADQTDPLGNEWTDHALCVCESCADYLVRIDVADAWAEVHSDQWGQLPAGKRARKKRAASQKKAEAKRGRKPLDATEQTVRMAFTMTQSTMDLIQARAKRENLSVSSFIRRTLASYCAVENERDERFQKMRDDDPIKVSL